MRQKKVLWVTIGAAVVLVIVLVGFGLLKHSHGPTTVGPAGHEGHNHGIGKSQASTRPHAEEEEYGPDKSTDHMRRKHDGHDEGAEKLALSGILKDGVRVVKMTARQFEFIPNKVVVKQNEKVRLEVTSEDVQHGIVIEEYDINRTVNPGKTETIIFTADKPGKHHFHCSVYCGEGHSEMHGELLVLSD